MMTLRLFEMSPKSIPAAISAMPPKTSNRRAPMAENVAALLAGIVVVAALLAYEHSLVSPTDLSRMNAAFFTVNGYISLLFLLFWGAAVAVWRV